VGAAPPAWSNTLWGSFHGQYLSVLGARSRRRRGIGRDHPSPKRRHSRDSPHGSFGQSWCHWRGTAGHPAATERL